MANLVTSGWAGGANVAAYPANSLAPSRESGAPAGAALETVAANAAGTATHATLSNDTAYVLYQASPRRVVNARIASSHVDRGVATGTGNTTAGSTDIASSAASLGAFVVGQRLAGPGIPNGARIRKIVGATLTMTEKATATATGVTIEATDSKGAAARVLRERDKRGTS